MSKILVTHPRITPTRRLGGVGNFVRLYYKFSNHKKYTFNFFGYGRQTIKLNWPQSFFYLFFDTYKFTLSLKKNKPDFLFMNTSLFLFSTLRNLLFINIANKSQIPIVFFIHGWQNNAFESFYKNKFLNYFFVKYLNTCDSIFVLSKEYRNKLEKIGICKEKIKLSSTMAICSKFSNADKVINKNINILFCSNIKEHKGPFQVLDTVSELSKEYKNLHYYFVGSGDDFNKLKKRVDENDLSSIVTLTGFVSEKEKIEIFNKSHIFILPTVHGEGFPTVIIEAMASGLNIICTENGGIKDNLVDGVNALFLRTLPPDSNEICQKIRSLVSNEKLFSEISKNNIQISRNNFDAKVVVTKINQAFDQINE